MKRSGAGASAADAPTNPPAWQEALVGCLAEALAAGGDAVQRFETHISWVLVAGRYAYKLKKALHLPFLDCSTLEARRFYCQQEYRLNRRLAPALYLDVVPVGGEPPRPLVDAAGEPADYAVRMRAFDQSAVWEARLAGGLLGDAEVDRLALLLARFHREAPRAPPTSAWGTAEVVTGTCDATLAALEEMLGRDAQDAMLAGLRAWQARHGPALAALVAGRKREGMVRECHGDLHCGNILTWQGEVLAFDCIEFDDRLRWIDVMDDFAFVHMDLAYRGRPDLAARLLSRYLEKTGDYAGLALLRHYRVHRALVRARVMLLRARQPGMPALQQQGCRRAALTYLAFARRCTRRTPAAIVAMHGPAGSGKTTVAGMLVELLGAVQLRSDVERKRLHGAASRAALYGEEATRRTYARLGELTRAVTCAGWPVVIDAACLKAAQRAFLRDLARDIGLPFLLVDLRADPATMLARIAARRREGRDASDADAAVLDRQLNDREALSRAERRQAVVIDTAAADGPAGLRAACAPVVAALRRHGVPAEDANVIFQAAHIDRAHIADGSGT
ncbi:AAA family ATPase [Massilia sp. BKSP1R2A-1]|uniref:bifunctional aminoglycoside phosphotransferase/ATP-binding protein n=1 Tax=Massilia sp. BKSP1R2A-1 TaxID=3422595 RepID=UPI003D332062